MKRRIVSAMILMLLLTGILMSEFGIHPVKAEPRTWIVDDDGPADFSKIQEAIIAANPGDTLLVYNGTYNENPIVNKTLLLIGESKSNTIISGNVSVEASHVQFKGFSVEGDMPGSGITLSYSDDSVISDNKITSKRWAGIILGEYSNNNTISNNIVVDNEYGINIGYFGGPVGCNNNVVSNNIVSNNTIGIEICTASTDNRIFGNIVENNSDGGILLLDAGTSNNKIYHNNMLHNGEAWHRNAEDLSSNIWDDGYPSGGNFWSDYNGTDADHDGIGDTSYVIDANNTDRYPIMVPWRAVSKVGVNVGEWAIYTITHDGNKTWPAGTFPSTSRNEVSGVVDTNMTCKNTDMWLNGSAQSYDGWIDVDTGMISNNEVFYFTAANLNVDELIYPSASSGLFLMARIDETMSKEYFNQTFEVNHYSSPNFTNYSPEMNQTMNLDLLWFKTTGRLAEFYQWELDGYANGTSFWYSTDVKINQIGGSPIYIRSDGSIDPPTKLIQRNGNVYTLTDDVTNNSIIIQRNDTVFDGVGHSLEGPGPLLTVDSYQLSHVGIFLEEERNVTIKNTRIADFDFGIFGNASSGLMVVGNNITENGINIEEGQIQIGIGIILSYSTDNIIAGNNLQNNGISLGLFSSSNTNITDNNIAENLAKTTSGTGGGLCLYSSSNNNVIAHNNVTNNIVGIGLASQFLGTPTNNTISENNVTNNTFLGLFFEAQSDEDPVIGNVVSGNNISFNGMVLNGSGVWFQNSNNNTLWGNTIDNSYNGVQMDSSSANSFFHNEFVDNGHDGNISQVMFNNSTNVWDEGYPSGGNYWSNYNGSDSKSGPYQNMTGSDGIGDTPYIININNTDNYPLMGASSEFNVVNGYPVQALSNSTISDFQFNGTALSFNVTGASGTVGFCRICIPTAMMNGTFLVFVNGTEVAYSVLPISNESYSYLYLNYTHSTEHVVILVPEFPSYNLLSLFIPATFLAVALRKKTRSSKAR